jgi:hypothetical protein
MSKVKQIFEILKFDIRTKLFFRKIIILKDDFIGYLLL